MRGREERKIILTMNPDELRELANKMEKIYPTLKMGQDCFVDFLHHESNFTVDLYLDQTWFWDREQLAKQKHTPEINERELIVSKAKSLGFTFEEVYVINSLSSYSIKLWNVTYTPKKLKIIYEFAKSFGCFGILEKNAEKHEIGKASIVFKFPSKKHKKLPGNPK